MAWTLRRRLVATVVALLTVVAAVIGVASALSLHQNLQSQLDQRVRDGNARAVHGPDLGSPDRSRAAPTGSSGSAGPFGSSTTSPSPAPSSTSTGPAPINRPGSEIGMVSVVVVDGQAVSGYLDAQGSPHALTAEQQAALLQLPTDGSVATVHLGALGRYRAAAVVAPDGVVMVTGLPTAALDRTVGQFALREVLVAAVGVLLAALGASWLVGRELRPLVRVAATATRVAELPLSTGEVVIAERVEPRDTDPRTEVGQVGAALNAMLGHVEQALTDRHESEQQVRQFVADASHELRTPLASIRGYAELVRRSPDELPAQARHALDRVESESVRMTSLVSDMLLLARLDAGRPLAAQPVDLAGLAVDAVADAHAAGPDHLWSLDLPGDDDVVLAGAWPGSSGEPSEGEPSDGALSDGELSDAELSDDQLAELDSTDTQPEQVLVTGDEDRLRQVLANLLSNARLHTPPGTHVTVQVRRTGREAVLVVQDDGPGIAEPLRSRLFQRFTRGDESRNRAGSGSSTGLGMAIAHAVVTAHHGTIEVTSRPGATTFTVRLPALD